MHSRLKHIPVKNMADSVVENCPRTFQDWSNRASSVCSRDTYHCVEDEKSRIVEVCAVPQWINAGIFLSWNLMIRVISLIRVHNQPGGLML